MLTYTSISFLQGLLWGAQHIASQLNPKTLHRAMPGIRPRYNRLQKLHSFVKLCCRDKQGKTWHKSIWGLEKVLVSQNSYYDLAHGFHLLSFPFQCPSSGLYFDGFFKHFPRDKPSLLSTVYYVKMWYSLEYELFGNRDCFLHYGTWHKANIWSLNEQPIPEEWFATASLSDTLSALDPG